MRTTKATSRLLAVVMALVMALSCTAMAAPNAPAAPELSDAVTLSLSENTTIAVSVPVSADVLAAAQAEGATVTWTLERVASYANPAEGFKVLLGESEMYPNEPDVIDPLNVPAAYQNYLTVNSVKTVCEPDEEFDDYHYLTMELDTTAMQSRGNASAPHANGGAYLDVCGEFRVVPTVNGTKIASDTTMIIKPYAGYHTMWEIYAELDRLSTLGDDNANTAAPYVVKESMGQSNLGYDMPYLIIAKDSETVSTWLALCARAETDPDGLAADLEKGLIDYKVPVVYSNIHANEVAAADGILKFAQMLVENETIEYNTLTGFTEEGQAKFKDQLAGWRERKSANDALEAEAEKNWQDSLTALEEWGNAKGLDLEQKRDVMLRLLAITFNGMENKYAAEDFDLAWNAINHDSDVEAARAEGEVAGRNAKIVANRRDRQTAGTMPPAPTGGQGAATKERKPQAGEENPWAGIK